MIATFALLVCWLSNALAATVSKTGDICLFIETDFTDLAGDNWTTNTDRHARGVHFEITDDVQTRSGFVDDQTGCLEDYIVQVEQNNGTFRLEIGTTARVNGVDMSSWRGADTTSKSFQTVVWNPSTGTAASTFPDIDRTVASFDQRWLNLAVGTMVFRIYDWNIGQGNDMDCCLEDAAGYATDGTCPSPSTGGYELLTTPVQMQTDPTGPAEACCGSTMIDNDPNVEDPPGLHTGTDVAYKFSIAHELGHVIAGMRMGGREQNNLDADQNACAGDLDGWFPFDSVGERGEFTKEYLSTVFREGWGNFVSVVTWNARSETSCEFQVQYKDHDYDLDGDEDSVRTNGLDGAYDCEGMPGLSGDTALQPYVTSSVDWLDELESASDGFSPPYDAGDCVSHINATAEGNRSTVYDFTRMMWDLTTDRGWSPGALADVYIDACPRGWNASDDDLDADVPLRRFHAAADLQDNNYCGIYIDVTNQLNLQILH